MNKNIGTLDYLKKMKERKTGQTENENNSLDSKSINEINSLDQATNFIRVNEKGLVQNTFNLAHTLKKIRDEKLYSEKYSSFEDYYDNELGYKKRMVYYFIGIAEKFDLDTKQEILELGVKKLILLSTLPEDERNKLLGDDETKKLSNSELKNKIDDLRKEQNSNYIVNINDDEVKEINNFYKGLKMFSKSISSINNKNKFVEKEHATEINAKIQELENEINRIKAIFNKFV